MKIATIVASTAWLAIHASAQQFVMYTPGGDDTSVQRADPVISPGQLSQHVHQIFGSNAFAPGVSYQSLQGADCTTVGDASGNGNAADKSNYWHPALFMEALDGSGYIRVPTSGHKMYYKNAGTGQQRNPFEFPQGFRMVAGNPFMRAPGTDAQQHITQWICHSNGGSNEGAAGGFPTGVKLCDAYPGFNGAIHFPHCWNGQDFNQANPTAHVVYPDGDIENGVCPSSHPIRLPHIFIENQFDVDKVASLVKPDSFVLAMGDDTGFGWHADFFNGWDSGAIPGLLASCPQGQYGNQDIGGCPTFKKFATKNTACKLKTTYVENVDKPGKYLPGCNPVSNTNPAPYYETAPLGTSTNQCPLKGGGAAPPQPGTTIRPTSTKTSVPTKAPTASPPTQPSTAISCPASNHKPYTFSGKTFRVQCGIDYYGGDLKNIQAATPGACLSACAKTSGCVGMALRGQNCYLKSSLGTGNQDSGVVGARLAGTPRSHRRDVQHMHAHMHGAHMRRRSF